MELVSALEQFRLEGREGGREGGIKRKSVPAKHPLLLREGFNATLEGGREGGIKRKSVPAKNPLLLREGGKEGGREGWDVPRSHGWLGPPWRCGARRP